MTAEQCSDGWYVKITETRLCASKHDVIALARHEGLRYDKTALNEVFIKEEQEEQCTCEEVIGKIKKRKQKEKCPVCSKKLLPTPQPTNTKSS